MDPSADVDSENYLLKHKRTYKQKEKDSNVEENGSNSYDSLLEWSANTLINLPLEAVEKLCLVLNSMENESLETQFTLFENSLSEADIEDLTKAMNSSYSRDSSNTLLDNSSLDFDMKLFSNNQRDIGSCNRESNSTYPNVQSLDSYNRTNRTQVSPDQFPLSSIKSSVSSNPSVQSQPYTSLDGKVRYNSNTNQCEEFASTSASYGLPFVPNQSFSQAKQNQNGNHNIHASSSSKYPKNNGMETSSTNFMSSESWKSPPKEVVENFLSKDSPFAKKYGLNVSKILLDKINNRNNDNSLKKPRIEREDREHGMVSSSTHTTPYSNQYDYEKSGDPMFSDERQIPDTSSSEKSSSRKDRKWSLGTHNLCKVCGDKAAGYYCGAFVCEACKKFFMRASKQQKLKYCCIKDQKCVITKESRVQCQYCRYQKCLSLNMTCPGPGVAEKKGEGDIGDIPCRVCGAPSSGFHFGALTCEGCKGFFRRMAKERETRHYQCSKNEKCEITSLTRNLCKACRYKKCIDAGMSIEASRIGRQPNSVKHAISLELQQMGQNPQACHLDFKNLNDPSKEFDSRELQEQDLKEVKVKVEPQEIDNLNCFRKSPPHLSPDAPVPVTQCSEDFEVKYQRIIQSIEAMNLELLNLIVRSEKSKPENDLSNFTDHKKCWAFMLIEFENHAACLIRFSKRIAGFRKLPLDDQINLVQDSIYPIVILNQSRLFDMENKVIHYFNYTEWEHKMMLEYYPQLRELINHFMHAGELVKTIDFDEMEITFLSVLLLLNPDKDGLENKTYVEELQVEVTEVLEEYEKRTYNNGQLRFGLILLRLSEFHVFTVKHNIAVGVLLSEHPTLEMPQLYKEMFGAAVGGIFRRERSTPKFPGNPIPDDSVIQEELASNSAKMAA